MGPLPNRKTITRMTVNKFRKSNGQHLLNRAVETWLKIVVTKIWSRTKMSIKPLWTAIPTKEKLIANKANSSTTDPKLKDKI